MKQERQPVLQKDRDRDDRHHGSERDESAGRTDHVEQTLQSHDPR